MNVLGIGRALLNIHNLYKVWTTTGYLITKSDFLYGLKYNYIYRLYEDNDATGDINVRVDLAGADTRLDTFIDIERFTYTYNYNDFKPFSG